MYGWLTFYHQGKNETSVNFVLTSHKGHEVAKDFKSYMTDLQVRLQRVCNRFDLFHILTQIVVS